MPGDRLGVVLLNMGGPESLDDVPAYLLNIFRDPRILDIPLGRLIRPWLANRIVKKRAAASADRYRQIGGKTPLNEITQRQAAAMESVLRSRGIDALVVPAMRYWHPFATEAVGRFHREGVGRIVALSMYPAYCDVTSGSSFDDLQVAVDAGMPSVPVVRIREWPALPAYAQFLAQHAQAALETIGEEHWARTAVLFSAHSVPMKVIERGDPYRGHIEQIYRLVCAALPRGVKTALGWQSAVGPARWLEPDSKAVIKTLQRDNVENLVVVPLGFVAENIETLWDIEMDLQSFARAHGFARFCRVSCPNDDATVMEALAGLIVDAREGTGHEH